MHIRRSLSQRLLASALHWSSCLCAEEESKDPVIAPPMSLPHPILVHRLSPLMRQRSASLSQSSRHQALLAAACLRALSARSAASLRSLSTLSWANCLSRSALAAASRCRATSASSCRRRASAAACLRALSRACCSSSSRRSLWSSRSNSSSEGTESARGSSCCAPTHRHPM